MKLVVSRRFTRSVVAALSWFCIVARGEEFVLQLDQAVAQGVPGPGAGVIETSTATDIYTFEGTEGQHVFLEELSADATFNRWLQWEIKSPTGKSVMRSYLDTNQEGRRTLPETGTYTVRVWVGANNPEYIGNYSFVIRSIPPDTIFPIQIGQDVGNNVPGPGAGRIEVPGARDIYPFSANAGDLILVEELSVAPEFKGWLYWELRSPSDQVLAGSYFEGNNNEGRKTLPEAGTYTIHVFARANDPTYIGDYFFRTRAVPRDQTFAINVGDTVADGVPAPGAGRIESPGAEDTYTFTGTSGQALFFDAMSADPAFEGWLQWQARTPSGQLLFSDYIGGGNVGRKVLPETGTYTLRLAAGATKPSYVGPYSFRITSAGDDAAIALRLGDTVAEDVPSAGAGKIEAAGGQDTYTFQGETGQSVVFAPDSVAEAFQGWLRWQVKAPSGTVLFDNYLRTEEPERKQLSESGLYTLRVYVGDNRPQFIGAYSFRVYSEVFANPDTFATAPAKPLLIPESKLLCNDQWHPLDSVQVELPVQTTAEGGTVSKTSAGISYTPKAGFSGPDHFEYALTGNLGGRSTAMASVYVYEGADQHPMVVSVLGKGSATARVCLLGEPGQTYEVHKSDWLGGWSKIGTLTADSTGSMDYEYTPEPGGMGFYRFFRAAAEGLRDQGTTGRPD